MGKFKKMCKKISCWDCKNLFCFGSGYVRIMLFCSIVLLLIYSLVFHNVIIIMVILMLALALAATFFQPQ